MGILQKQMAIIEAFEAVTDQDERNMLIIAKGKGLPSLPDADKTEEAKVRGCSSSVWLHATFENGVINYRGDSDAILVRGLVALLLEVYSGETPANILKHEPLFIEEIGLSQFLSQTRANGLGSMVKQIKAFAVAFQAEQA